MIRTLVLAVALVAAGPAWSAAKEPPPVFAEAARALADAEAAGAADYAPMEVGFARERLDRANALWAKRDQRGATRVAEQARADARLSLAKCRAGKARAALEAARAENERLRRELLGRGES